MFKTLVKYMPWNRLHIYRPAGMPSPAYREKVLEAMLNNEAVDQCLERIGF